MTGFSHREFKIEPKVSEELIASNFRVEERGMNEATFRALR